MARSVDELLQSVSDVLFPAENREKIVSLASRSSEGDTALHVMAWRRDLEGAQLLIAAGADVKNTEGQSTDIFGVRMAPCMASSLDGLGLVSVCIRASQPLFYSALATRKPRM